MKKCNENFTFSRPRLHSFLLDRSFALIKEKIFIDQITMRLTLVGSAIDWAIKLTIFTLVTLIAILFFYERIKVINNMSDSAENSGLLNNLKSGRFVKSSAAAAASNRGGQPVGIATGTISNNPSFDPNLASPQLSPANNAGGGGNVGKRKQREEKGTEIKKGGDVGEEEEEDFDDDDDEEGDFDGDDEGNFVEGEPAVLKGILKPHTNEHQPTNLDIGEETTGNAVKTNGKRKKKSGGALSGGGEKECVGCQTPAKKRTKKNPIQPHGSTATQVEISPQTGSSLNGETAYSGATKCSACVALQKAVKGLLKTLETFVVPA